ncbi:MAG: ribonuclease activity regulator RraA [Dehalococcoidia bacterium]|jgi:regulator of RNase E activity RraA|nr:ribonuclease activity regulator RraA [Dehalococcoidia bacterium]|tara:strand:- start:6690 stop:7427 length:738 start_codon:yes stop_codon:yes gene_type:complete
MKINNIKRPDKKLIEKLRLIGTATASGELNRLGIKDAFIQGPISYTPGKTIAGPAITLQFLPMREDIYSDDQEMDPEVQLHRHALYIAEEGDIVVVDARGDLRSGVFGEMMLTYFQGKGGEGIIVDGVIRDFTHAKDLELGMWLKGVTPNYHTQVSIFPNAVNIPISCGGVLVNPGDIILADDDGAVVVPISLAEKLAETATGHAEWEVFARKKLSEGGELREFYPRNAWSEETEKEYSAWLENN